MLRGLLDCSEFSTQHFKAGYHQVPMAIGDSKRRLPSGFFNAVPTFQRLMDQDLVGLKWKTYFFHRQVGTGPRPAK